MFYSFIYLFGAVFPASSIADLTAVDAAVRAMELQVQAIKDRLREETQAIPKTKVLIHIRFATEWILLCANLTGDTVNHQISL